MTARVNLLFRDGTKVVDKEYLKGHMTYAEIKKGPWTDEQGISHGSEVYMRRWYLLVFPNLFSIRVHHIKLADLDRWPHDHPWSFLSIILRGGYEEWWCTPDTFRVNSCDPDSEDPIWTRFKTKWVRRFNFHRNTDLHQIRKFDRGDRGAWTLIFTGPERREWGFMTNNGWLSRVALNLGASAPRDHLGPEPD